MDVDRSVAPCDRSKTSLHGMRSLVAVVVYVVGCFGRGNGVRRMAVSVARKLSSGAGCFSLRPSSVVLCCEFSRASQRVSLSRDRCKNKRKQHVSQGYRATRIVWARSVKSRARLPVLAASIRTAVSSGASARASSYHRFVGNQRSRKEMYSYAYICMLYCLGHASRRLETEERRSVCEIIRGSFRLGNWLAGK